MVWTRNAQKTHGHLRLEQSLWSKLEFTFRHSYRLHSCNQITRVR